MLLSAVLGVVWASGLPLFSTLQGGPEARTTRQVRDAEIAFAKAFADRDKAAFFAMVADDATFLAPRVTSVGKKAVIENWSPYFDGDAPFSWAPDRVSVSADGTLGLSTGPVYDPRGMHAGDYISTWRRDAKGEWKIVFDSTGPGPAPLPEHAPKIEEGFITTPDGVKLFYRKIGRGPLTAIVPLDFALFDQVKQFSNLATIITYDLRNRGRSGKAKDVKIQDDVRDLETVREHFKLEKFVPIGFSYLGKMVMMYAAEHPHRIARLIQLGPLGNKRIDMPIAQDFGAPQSVLAAFQESQKPDADPKQACVALANLMSYYMTGNPKNAAKFDVAGSCAHENEYPVNLNPHFASLMSSSGGPLTAEQLAKVTAPVLTIHGKKDRQAAYEGGVAWVKSLPNARLVTLEGAAHAMWLDDPATFGASIRQFLRGEWPLAAQSPTADAPASGRASTPTAPDGGGSVPRKDE